MAATLRWFFFHDHTKLGGLGALSEAGGKTNEHHHYSVSHTARDELFEESGVYFVIPDLNVLKKLPTFDHIHTRNCKYKVYVLRVPSALINKSEYLHNVKSLESDPQLFKGDCYRETSGIVRIPIKKLGSALKAEKFHKRTREVLDYYLNKFSDLGTFSNQNLKFEKGKIQWGQHVLYHILVI